MGASNTKFSKKSTAMQSADSIDLNGKTILITGCNTGIGKETARVLAIHGAKIYMLCRNMEKANKAREDIIKSIKEGTGTEGNKNFDDTKIVTLELDLSSLLSVRRCVGKYLSLNEPIDYLINNAGIMAVPEWRGSKDGYEMQFATNHLGHFYLTTLLTPLLLKCTPSRVINLASSAHSQSPKIDNEKDNFITQGINIKDGPLQKDYGMKGWKNYGLSKACNVLFAREYNRRYQKNGIISVSLHPGVIKTELGRHTGSVGAFFLSVGSVFMKSIPQGAATTVRCVSLTDEEIAPGHYYKDCNEANSALRKDIQPYRGLKVDQSKVTKPATTEEPKKEDESKADVETDKDKDAPKDDAEKEKEPEAAKDEEPKEEEAPKADEAANEEDKPKESEVDKTEDKPEDADKEKDDGDKAKEEEPAPKEEEAPKQVEETKDNDLEEETKTESQEIEQIEDVNSAEYKLWEWSELLITEKGFKLDMDGFEEEEKERQLQEEKEEAERLEKERLEKEAAEQKAKEDAEKAAKEEEEKKEDKPKEEEAPKDVEDAPKEEVASEVNKGDDQPKEEETVAVDEDKAKDEEAPKEKEEDAPKEEVAADDTNEAEAPKEEEPKEEPKVDGDAE